VQARGEYAVHGCYTLPAELGSCISFHRLRTRRVVLGIGVNSARIFSVGVRLTQGRSEYTYEHRTGNGSRGKGLKARRQGSAFELCLCLVVACRSRCAWKGYGQINGARQLIWGYLRASTYTCYYTDLARIVPAHELQKNRVPVCRSAERKPPGPYPCVSIFNAGVPFDTIVTPRAGTLVLSHNLSHIVLLNLRRSNKLYVQWLSF